MCVASVWFSEQERKLTVKLSSGSKYTLLVCSSSRPGKVYVSSCVVKGVSPEVSVSVPITVWKLQQEGLTTCLQ